jgi:putative oxidoreductase
MGERRTPQWPAALKNTQETVMHIALWIVQALLAFAFLMAGGMKMAAPISELLANGMTFVEHTPEALVRFIGVAEFAGALGLILPSALRIQPKLTPIAAGLLAVVMVLGAGTHVMLGEFSALGAPIVLGGLSAFVAWGRWTSKPIAARQSALAA